jgi:hypothetical protein
MHLYYFVFTKYYLRVLVFVVKLTFPPPSLPYTQRPLAAW